MTPEQFCYWLQGYFEIEKPDFISEKRVSDIKSHLDRVFNNKSPKPPNNIVEGFEQICINSFMEKGSIIKESYNMETKQWEREEPIKFTELYYNDFHPVSC